MDLGLKGKKAIVTGGTRGIGRAIAETLAGEGVDVAICARNQDQVDEAITALSKFGVKATGGVADIADGEGLKKWIADMGKVMGGIDILVANASALANGNDEKSWRACFEIDVLGAVNAFEAALPFLTEAAKKSGDASATFISSISAAENDNANAYGAQKAAQIHLAKGLARQHAGDHVRVNTVSPGTVYFKGGVWNMIEDHMPDMFKQAMSRNPTGRMATPQDIANAAVFLASPASSFTTGSNLVVDGAISRRVNF
ncbi:SDR family oxidoreductase [Parvibaculum sp.]|jgi:3-oxoacyl-[acyl-carrier protein] reductase|uniref:SDR family NAD(P)-dependent oxidoreductase n=1 Tax=Parvibaculum sp. TaxID=2024848 RepID=UPI000C354795|nr:SDR family oxidoreductase [Parvibaculum sp.]MAM95748.1 3-ketoacyl-ACP reductase [Parvibaculum sp.]HCX66238.1 3-ketoacyl-ACP reductase [Rhodobiaceae bacterium]|tara:strand:- start:31045 stop:31815 length:771 start_codon:yes stop_codon:yes gene_type:complete